MDQKNKCDHCTKEDCKECVTDGGKTFCCQKCCDEYKEKSEEKKKEPANVCKFC